MSTRATVHFKGSKNGKSEAIIYRHGDGYPNGLGRDLERFLDEVENQTKDTRFDDPSYLAAKWVVYDAAQMCEISKDFKPKGIYTKHPDLDFLSVGICREDPGDIEYRYLVICKDENRPEIIVQEV